MFCSKSYNKSSEWLCQSLVDLTRRMCREDINPQYISKLLNGRLVPLDKNPGIRPVGVGEVIRRIMAKAVVKVLGKDIQDASGTLQSCSGLESGIEATVHAMAKSYQDDDTEAMLLVDADNAFNSLNRKTALLNIKSLCPTFYTFLNNLYRKPVTLFVANTTHTISSEEGSTQGCPAAMTKYALGTIPLVDRLHEECAKEGTN